MDGNGIPLSATTTKANAHDLVSALPTIDGIRIGRQRRRPKRLRADKGYDSIRFRQELRARGIRPAIDGRAYAHRRKPERCWNDAGEIRYSPKRWCVEQRIACIDQHRRLDFLWERTRVAYNGFLTIAFIKCYLVRLSKSKRSFRRI